MTRSRPLGRECRVDIYEENGSIIMEAELPGVEGSQIQLEVGSDLVSIRARPIESEEPRRYHRQERHLRYFERDIPLPVRIDRENVVAMIRDGVLVVDLGAKDETPAEVPRGIAINSGSVGRERPFRVERVFKVIF